MAEHNILGKNGEDIAAAYLVQKGYIILSRNWHCRHKEIDIIAMDGCVLVFVEVKTRSRELNPSDLISYAKVRFLESAAESYIRQKRYQGDARFDIISIIKEGSSYSVEHIPEAFR